MVHVLHVKAEHVLKDLSDAVREGDIYGEDADGDGRVASERNSHFDRFEVREVAAPDKEAPSTNLLHVPTNQRDRIVSWDEGCRTSIYNTFQNAYNVIIPSLLEDL